jgi:hypothetical protein
MKVHRTDTLSLAFGMLFLIIAGTFLANRAFEVRLPNMGLVVAVGIVVLGAIIAVTALFPHRKPKSVATEPEKDPIEVDENL